MKKHLVLLFMLLILLPISSFAESPDVEFDPSQYSYEELLIIKDLVDTQIAKYPSDHANRVISFGLDQEIVLFTKRASN